MQPTPEQQAILDAAEAGSGKLISISRGLMTLVSSHRHAALVSMGKWTAFKSNKGNQIYYYAGRKENGKLVLMSRLICNCPEGLIADHKNGNTLWNLDDNIRPLTKRENRLNSHNMHARNTSGVEGVYFDVLQQKWIAQLGRQRIGSFFSKEEAIAARIIEKQSALEKEIWETSHLHQSSKQSLIQ